VEDVNEFTRQNPTGLPERNNQAIRGTELPKSALEKEAELSVSVVVPVVVIVPVYLLPVSVIAIVILLLQQ
jgi:hypothetical protein